MVQLEPYCRIRLCRRTSFQFHYGSIRTMMYYVQCDHVEAFNSIMVQLEHIRSQFSTTPIYSFNSIMVQLELSGNEDETLLQQVLSIPLWFNQNPASKTSLSSRFSFQFHYGSIRTRVVIDTDELDYTFNSIMVQLEPVSCAIKSVMLPSFQFHYGSIRTHIVIKNQYICMLSIPLWFNQNNNNGRMIFNCMDLSIPLWFNQNSFINRGIVIVVVSFNSIMVQLEHGLGQLYALRIIFQFHYGSIRTKNEMQDYLRTIFFQFHYGSIRTFSHFRLNSG